MNALNECPLTLFCSTLQLTGNTGTTWINIKKILVTKYTTHNVHLDRCILVCKLLGKNVSQRCVIFFHLNIKDYQQSTQNEVAVKVCKKKKKEKANVKIRRKMSVVYLVALNEV